MEVKQGCFKLEKTNNGKKKRFGEHLRSTGNLPGFPVAARFNTADHSIHDALVRAIMLCGENPQRKRLIFQLDWLTVRTPPPSQKKEKKKRSRTAET